MAGNTNIPERRRALQKQLAELQATLDVIDYKYWYYQVTENTGILDIRLSLSTEEQRYFHFKQPIDITLSP